MSNDIYKILNNFNKLTEQKPQPTEQKVAAKPKTKLQESIEQVNEKYMGFKKTVAAIKKGGSAENPEAVAAAIGRKKYGKEKFQKAAAAGKKLSEMDKSQPSSDRGGESSGNPYAKGGKAIPVKSKDAAKDAEQVLNKAMDKAHKKNVKEEQQDESALQAYLGKKKYGEKGMKALQQAGREGASKEKMAKIRAQHDKMDEQQGMAEGIRDDAMAGLQKTVDFAKQHGYKIYRSPTGRKMRFVNPQLNHEIRAQVDNDGDSINVNFMDYYTGMSGNDDASYFDQTFKKAYEQVLGDYQNRRSDDEDDDGPYTLSQLKLLQKKGVAEGSLNEKAVSKAQQKFMGMVHAAQKGGKAASPEVAKVAKGMSKKAAKDYASTKHKGLPQHVNETIIKALQEGYSKEQIVQYILENADKEYWKDLMKDVPDKGAVSKTVHKGHYGTEYQGDSDEDDDDGKKKIAKPTGEKRGRGRPKGVKNRVVRAGEKKAASTGEKRGRGRPPGSKNKMKEAWEIEHTEMISEAYFKLVEKELGQRYHPERMPNLPPPVPTDPTYTKDPKTGQLVPDVPKPTAAPKPAAPKGTEKRSDIEGDTEVVEMMRLAGMEGKLHGRQHKLDVDKDGDIQADDLADLRAGKVDEGDMEEGNEFSGALDAARDAGKKEFEVDGRTYPVKESQLDECGEMGPMANGMGAEQEGKMNVSTHMSSDGTKSVTVTADGEAAVELMQMLALAGMKQPEAAIHQEPEIAVMSMEDKDPRYEANTTPEEDIIPLETQLKGGDGDVAGKEKQMNPHGSARFSDNPLAVKESISLKLMKEYEAIKVKK